LLGVHTLDPAAAIENVDRDRTVETIDPSSDKNCFTIATTFYERVVENGC